MGLIMLINQYSSPDVLQETRIIVVGLLEVIDASHLRTGSFCQCLLVAFLTM